MSAKSGDLWLKIINEGVEDRVEVNQRMLIDKMLSRYSSEFVVYRELIQNSDDAQSSSFILEIDCDPPNERFNYQSIHKRSKLEEFGKLLRNPLGFYSNSSDEKKDSDKSIDQFDNCLIREIRTINNGNVFNEEDWKRVITIAEGNNNVDAIGQFGVGFFSVFSYSEKPMIKSGKHCLAFAWQNGKSLTTFRKELTLEEQTLTTSIILPMKNPFLVQSQLSIHSSKAKKNIQTNEIIPTLDLIQLKNYLTKVLSFTKYIKELIIQINGSIVFQVNKLIKPMESNKYLLAPKQLNRNNQYHFLYFNSFQQSEQRFSISNGPYIDLLHLNVQAKVEIDQQFRKQIEQVIKKDLPSSIDIEFLFPSNKIFEEEQWKNNSMLKELIPLKFIDGKVIPSGQIFIGLSTHQSTGIGMHLFTHFIPTIERENIDLQDPYISIWNEQLFISIGKILRFLYSQTILSLVNNSQQSTQMINILLSPYAFERSTPNPEIGRLIVDGFFSCEEELLVPVKRSPSDIYLSLIPSNEAYLSNSKEIQSFLPIPLVPFEISENEFFQILKRRQWIEEINLEKILKEIHRIIVSFDELIGLLRWLCRNDIYYIKQILSQIRYRSNNLIELKDVKYYDTLNIPMLPLPSNVLPSNVVSFLSREDLEKRLSLLPMSKKELISYYLNQTDLLSNENDCKRILSFLSENINQLNPTELKQMKEILGNVKCIPTSRGMNIPNQSFIPSIHLSSHLPLIELNIPQIESNEKEYPVSMEFLKLIGCRTIYLPQRTNSNKESEEDFERNESFIENLLKERKGLSDNDLKALKESECLIGSYFPSSKKMKSKPNELHFPSVGIDLQWNNLLILDWSDIQFNSREYFFLKELGVKEVPHFKLLIERINEEYSNQSKSIEQFQLPKSLLFFAKHFQEYYSKSWKHLNNQIPFLPSLSNQSKEVFLTKPEFVFKEMNPLFPWLIPDVIKCFSLYFDLTLIGVKERPSIIQSFQILLDKKNQLLNYENASKSFSYLNQLDGINQTFIQNISTISFIPLPDQTFAKPSQVFIRSKSNEENDQMVTNGLIDYVDFGREGNSFLSTIGVLSYPSAEYLIDLLIERQEKYFHSNENEEIMKKKLNFYTNCLKQLSIASTISQQFHLEPLKSRLIKKPWALAYQYVQPSKERIFKIVKPSDIYLDDDHQSAIDINPLCAPDEPELINFYHKFGAKWLSENIQRILIHQGKYFSSERSNQLFQLINHRLDMLFVNNRGEKFDNFNEKRFQLLKNAFSVYECESIQCQIFFQNRTIILNSNECSSCAIESNNKSVLLFLAKDLPTLDYIDIATELTRFVYQKTIDTLIHSISDKLSSPLETLKRRGIPVDRLLKITQKQPIHFALQIEQKKKEDPLVRQREEQVHQEEKSEGLIDNLKKSLLVPYQSLFKGKNSIEDLPSEMKINRIKDFNANGINDSNEIKEMKVRSRPYSKKDFDQSESTRYENNNSCEFVPESKMIRYEKDFHGIYLFVDHNVPLTDLMKQQGKQLSYILSSLIKQVFDIPIQTINLFRDIDSARIAFNSNGSIFYNLRYFEQVFADQLNLSLEKGNVSSSSNSILRKVINFYYMVSCHELTHNLDANHDLNFLNRFERISVQLMDEKDRFLSSFSFSNKSK